MVKRYPDEVERMAANVQAVQDLKNAADGMSALIEPLTILRDKLLKMNEENKK